MISKAQDMENNIFILPGVLNIDFNEFLRLYFEKKLKTSKIQKMIFDPLCKKTQGIQRATQN